MSTRWRILDLVDYTGVIDIKTGRVVINSQEVVMSDVACVLTGDGTKWSGSFVQLMAKFDIPILACDWRGVPVAATLPWSDNTRVGARHQAQASQSLPRQKNAWTRIVKAKIEGQANNLELGSTQRDRLVSMISKVRSGDAGNSEASAARTYWSCLFKPEKFTRNRDLGGRNALLNYGYAIVRGGVIRAVAVAGLAPALGIYHRNRSNTFALADDLMEPFRPVIDSFVKELPASADLTDRSVKAKLVSVLAEPISGYGETVLTAMTTLARNYAQYVEGDIQQLQVPVWTPRNG